MKELLILFLIIILGALSGCAPLLAGVTGSAVCSSEGLWHVSCVEWRD